MMMMERIMITCAYDGSSYHGWQKQPGKIATIESIMQQAIEKIALHEVQLIACGRTDKGVHALRQTIHFDTSAKRPLSAWVRGVNCYLPRDIAVRNAQIAPADFHARFSALSRAYRYLLYSARQRPVMRRDSVTWVFYPLVVEKMQQAAQLLIGEHDFSSFRSPYCQARSPIKRLMHAQVYRTDDMIAFDFIADGFLHHMVRNIVAALVGVGRGHLSVSDLAKLLASKNRQMAPPTFSAKGLYFLGAHYPPQFNLQTTIISSAFWGDHEFTRQS